MEYRKRLIQLIWILSLILIGLTCVDSFRWLIRPVKSETRFSSDQGQDMTPSLSGISNVFSLPEIEHEAAQDLETGETWISRAYGIALKGTVSEELAIVEMLDSGKERLLHPDDQINGGTVSGIKRNHLEISGVKGDVILTLPLKRTGENKTTHSSARVKTLNRAELSGIMQRIDKLSQEISLTPLRGADGGLFGYKITALKPGGLIGRMGMRKNDILISVNDVAVRTPEDVYRTFGEAYHANRLTLQLRRNQRDMEFVYQIR